MLSHSQALDEIYAFQKLDRSLKTLKAEYGAIQSPTESEGTSSGSSENPSETMLLSPSSGRLIADCLGAPDIEQEVERAIHQVEASLRAERELEEEKRAIQSSTTKPVSKDWQRLQK